MKSYRGRRRCTRRHRWIHWHDNQWHKNQHHRHAAYNAWHIILGGIVVLVLLCCCGSKIGVF